MNALLVEQRWADDAWLTAAVAEVERRIQQWDATATFVRAWGDDPPGLYLETLLDRDEPMDVLDSIGDHLLELQVKQGLPLHMVPLHRRG